MNYSQYSYKTCAVQGGSRFLRNVCNNRVDSTVSHRIRLTQIIIKLSTYKRSYRTALFDGKGVRLFCPSAGSRKHNCLVQGVPNCLLQGVPQIFQFRLQKITMNPHILDDVNIVCPDDNWGRDSSVGIATRYELDGPGIESRWGEIFRTCPDRPWGPPGLLNNGYRVSPRGKRSGSGFDHPPPLARRLKKEQSYTSTPLWPLWPVIG